MKNWKKWLCLALILALTLGLSACARQPAAEAYPQAQQLLAEGKYEEAAKAFADLGSYEEASRLALYAQAHAEAAKGNYGLAVRSMTALGDFRDASLQATYYQVQGLLAQAPYETYNYLEAETLLPMLGAFRQSHEIDVNAVAYQDGLRLVEAGSFEAAVDVFHFLANRSYQDASTQKAYARARNYEAAGKLVDAVEEYSLLGEFRDSATRVKACADAAWQKLLAHVDASELKAARELAEQMDRSGFFGDYAELPLLKTYVGARELEAEGGADIAKYTRAAKLYAELGDFRDAAQRAQSIPQSIYDNAVAALDSGDFDTALTLFDHQREYLDSAAMYDYTNARSLQAEAERLRDNLAQRVTDGRATFDDVYKLWEASQQACDAYEAIAEAQGEFRDCEARAAASLNLLYDYAMSQAAEKNYALAANILSVAQDQPGWYQQQMYLTAQHYLEVEDHTAENVAQAREYFIKAGELNDAATRAEACVAEIRSMGDAALAAGDYKGARDAFEYLPDAKESRDLTKYVRVREAEAEASTDYLSYSTVAMRYEQLGDVRDSAERAAACREALFAKAEALYAEGKYAEAAECYFRQPDYKDGANKSRYAEAMQLEVDAAADPVKYARAADVYEGLGEYSDAAQRAAACRETLFQLAETALAEGRYGDAAAYYSSQPTYNTAEMQVAYVSALALEAEGATDPAVYLDAAKAFDDLGDFRDAAARAAACRETLFQLGETALAEARYTDAAGYYRLQPEYKDGEKRAAYAEAALVEALAAEAPEKYVEAAAAFDALGEFGDAADRAAACRETLFQLGETALAEARYTDAAGYYRLQPEYKDGENHAAYAEAALVETLAAEAPEKYAEAAAAFDALGEFGDAADRAAACRKACYDRAVALVDSGDYSAAQALLTPVKDYADAAQQIDYCNARILVVVGDYPQALPLLVALGDFRDAPAHLAQVQSTLYARATAAFEVGKLTDAAQTLRLLGDYEDASPFAAYAEGLAAEAAWLEGDAAQLEAAKAAYAEAGDFRDAAAHLSSVTGYAEGLDLLAKGEVDAAKAAFTKLGDYQQAETLAYRLATLKPDESVTAEQLTVYCSAMADEARGADGNVQGYIAAADRYESLGAVMDAPQHTTRLRNKLNILFADKVREEHEGLRAVQRNGKWGFANAEDELISDFQWDEIKDFAEGFAAVKKDGKWGFIRKNGTLLNAPIYDKVWSFSEGRARIYAGEHYDYVKTDGSLLLKSISSYSTYSNATDFHQGRAMVLDAYWGADGWKLIDIDGKELLDESVRYSGSWWYIKEEGTFSNGFARIGINQYSFYSTPDRYIYIDLNGTYISDSEPALMGNYWKISHNGKDAFMDMDCKIVTFASTLDFNDAGYCLTTGTDGKGMIHSNGKTITPNRWEEIHHFSCDRALVKSGNYYGFIDTKGATVVKCEYNDAHDFADGLAMVKLNGMCGFINTAGEIVVPLIYDDATDFVDGKATVQRYGQWTTIGTDGKPVN